MGIRENIDKARSYGAMGWQKLQEWGVTQHWHKVPEHIEGEKNWSYLDISGKRVLVQPDTDARFLYNNPYQTFAKATMALLFAKYYYGVAAATHAIQAGLSYSENNNVEGAKVLGTRAVKELVLSVLFAYDPTVYGLGFYGFGTMTVAFIAITAFHPLQFHANLHMLEKLIHTDSNPRSETVLDNGLSSLLGMSYLYNEAPSLQGSEAESSGINNLLTEENVHDKKKQE